MLLPSLGERYAAVRRLGAGAQGEVWLASDRRMPGRQVAVKRIVDEAQVSSLRREFALLARLQHPGLAAVHELLEVEGALLLVRELIAGEALLEWARPRPRAAGLEALAELLGTLDFLHRRGVVHRDLKPEHVLVGAAGVKLLDLGLASAAGQRAATSGTAGYLAPEVLAGAAPTAKSDLYAVGVLLHQLVLGRPPFAGSALEVTAAQLQAEVALPVLEDTPGLHELLRRLLARDPSRRPGSAAEVLALLEEKLGAPGAAARALAGRGLGAPALVGREAPLDAARAALAAVRTGPPPRGLLLVGPPGAGRSRLCEEIAGLAQLAGLRVLRGLPGEAALPAAAGVAEGALAVQRVVASVRAAAAGAALLVVDDLEDLHTAEALLALCRLDDLPLCLCVAGPPGAAEELLAPSLERLALAPLSAGQTAALVSSMLPTGWGGEELGAALHRLAGGSPLLAAELTRHAVARQLAGEPGTLLELVERSSTELAAQEAGPLRLRLRDLEPRARRLASVAALHEDGLPAELVQELAGEGALVSAGALRLQGILEEAGGRLRVAGRSLARALREELPPAERRALGRRALELLEQRGAPARVCALVALGVGLEHEVPALLAEGGRQARRELDPATAVRLLAAARDASPADSEERAHLAAELAALQLSLGQAPRAVETLAAALGTAPAGERTALALALADARLRAGQRDEALAGLTGLAGLAATALRAKVLLFSGRYEEARREAGAAAAGDASPELVAELEHTRGLACYYLGESEGARDALVRALEAARQAQDALTLARVQNSAALVDQRRGELASARGRYRECLRLARELRHLPFEATFLMNLGSVAELEADYPAALESYEASLEVARDFGGAREAAQVLQNLGRLRGLLGQDEQARALLHRSSRLAGSLGWGSLLAQDALVEGELELAAGRLPSARERLQGAERRFLELGEAAGAAEARLALARCHLAAGEPEAALRLAREQLEAAGGVDSVQLQAQLVAGRAELERAGGAPEVALEHLRAALRRAEASGERSTLVELHHWLARGAAAVGDAISARVHREAARAQLRRELDRLPPPLRRSAAAAGVRPEVLALESEEPEPAPARRELAPGAGRAALDASLLAALLAISKELNTEPDLRRLLERIVDHAVELAGAERGFLLLQRDAQLEIEVARNIDQETIRRKEFKLSRSVADEVLRSGRPLLTVDALEDDRFREFLSVHNLRLRSVLCVPITIRRLVRGAVYLDNRFQTQAFTERHVELLAALAEQAGLAVGNWELLDQNRRRQEELERSREELRAVNARLEEALAEQRLRVEELAGLARSQQGELEGRYRFESLIGQSAVMRELFRLMDRVKGSEAPVLIHGESGTGKELVAKALHYSGPRREGPFISVNCGALSPSLLEAELFGHERGAFTGAERQHRGLFERADGGSLFLDEVGEMPPDLQVKLLRVLQEKRFERLGGEHELASDFRLIAASNKDLAELVREGRFRQDLFFRLNVILLRLPPLRDRREDLPLLVRHLLERHAPGRAALVSPAALRLLLAHDWPGNVRELENELMRALALGGPLITPEDLSLRPRLPAAGPEASEADAPALTLKEATRRLELRMVTAALRECRGSVTEAARRLGMTRVGLHKLMKRHGVSREDEQA